MLGDVECEV